MRTINYMATQELNVRLQMPFTTVACTLNQGTIPKTGGNRFRAAFWLLFSAKK